MPGLQGYGRSVRRIEMDKLIRRSDVLALLPTDDTVGPKPSALRAAVEALQGVDVDSVTAQKHGRWEWYDNTISQRHIDRGHKCSECGCRQDDTTHYCPYCGAKMDGGAE